MGFSKKTAKGRLDKYYFAAKEQGFRARSAFKLIQLNKKFNFLEKARVLVDLCAAPGGWLQVAAKYMPVSQLIIGIDLCPIKPIPNVITLVDDITTEKCRADLRRELKTWKADVFLNDGAPNVGSSWAHDAFTQAELVLSALKLATDFLNEGGTFVTKIFRSKDYNSLLWVFKHLFKSVEATKPASSRNVSAEIFVVCRGYLAPAAIDPKFLDPKYVFQEVDAKSAASKSGSVNILHPEKKIRSREGYEDDKMIIHKAVPAIEFINSHDPTSILASANVLVFEDEASKQLLQSSADDEILECCRDLKVIGRKEFKALLKWRSSIRQAEKEAAKANDEPASENLEELNSLEKLDDLATQMQKKAKRERRKALERKAKQRLRLQLQMENTQDLADDVQEEGLFSARALKKKSMATRMMEANPAEEDEGVDSLGKDLDHTTDRSESELEEFQESLSSLSDDDLTARWEDEMEENYQRFKSARMEKDALRFVKNKHEDAEKNADSLSELDSGVESDQEASESCSSEEAGEEPSGLSVDINTADERKEALKAKAEMFYSNPIFGVLEKAKQASKTGAKRSLTDKIGEESEDEQAEDIIPQSEKKQKKAAKKQKASFEKKEKEEKEEKGIIFVKADPSLDEHFDEETKEMMNDPASISLATKLVADRRRQKQDLVDDSFNRYSFGTSKGLPSWFLEDESRHNKPQIPISKEAAAAIKEKLRKLEAQPNKKVLEAKGRNKMRALKRIEALKKKAAVIADSEEIGGRQKSEQIEKLMRSAKKSTKRETKVVVARGKLKGNKGRPKGVKGHYKMVDGRSKKDMRAVKAKGARGKGKSRGRK